MKILCTVQIENRRLSTLSSNKPVKYAKSTMALCRRHPKSDEYYMLLFTNQNKNGTKYNLKGNVKQILTRFINEGKCTIQFGQPEHNLYIQSDVIQLKSFLHLLKRILEDKVCAKELSVSSMAITAIKPKDIAPKKMVILNRSEYPIKGFPRTLEELHIKGIARCGVDKGIMQLVNLRVLDLSNNCIEMVPDEFNKLCNLKELHLSHNFVGKSRNWNWMGGPLANTLRLLDLSHNHLKHVPNQIKRLHQLGTLHLSNNSLEKLPDCIGRINRLRLHLLDISDNSFERADLNRPVVPQKPLSVCTLKEYAGRKVLGSKLGYGPGTLPITLAWQRQWCEIRRLDSVDCGVELKLKSNRDGTILNSVRLPRSSTICRTDSRTKQYAFGVFDTMRRDKKPILFLSGNSETNSQEWMTYMRRMLSVASYIPVGETTFRMSIVDNGHSRAAGLIGLHGVLGLDQQNLTLNDPCTGEPIITWKWFHFHQFHLQAPAQTVDDKKIVVMHTSGEFPAGPGQLLIFCEHGPKLLRHLIARGRLSRMRTNSTVSDSLKRLSRSEGDLCCAGVGARAPDSPLWFRSQAGSEDSGVRVSVASDDSEEMSKIKNACSLMSIGLVTKTPGESETEDSSQDLSDLHYLHTMQNDLPRNESGISLASGIYEEIPEDSSKKSHLSKYLNHVYENPLELIRECKQNHPPPLPPRKFQFFCESNGKKTFLSSFKQRCNTLPAKDLSKISQKFTSESETESEYEVMSPTKKTLEKLNESFYLPMSPKSKLENCYHKTGQAN